MSIVRALAAAIVAVAAATLPQPDRRWGDAMRREVASADAPLDALSYALGCLGFAARAAGAALFIDKDEGITAMPIATGLLHRQRLLAGLCAITATALGLAYLALTDAPTRYLAMNGAALLAGFLAVGIADQVKRLVRVPIGIVAVALASALFLTTWGGATVNAATRWLSIGTLVVQPSLMIVPVLALCSLRSPGITATIAIMVAAIVLAVQPDRAMAGALFMAMLASWVVRPDRRSVPALIASAAGFLATLLQQDVQPAMPWVDQILYAAFSAHPLAGAAVVTGTVALLVPGLAGLTVGRNREASAVFAAVWSGVIVAALLGNYPTPLVGYGGSAIVGYVLCLAGLPHRSRDLGLATLAPADGPRTSRAAPNHDAVVIAA